MLKRIALALLFAASLSLTAASAQEPGDLWFHRTVAGPMEFIQRAAVLPVPAPPPPNAAKALGPGLSIANQLAVDAALQWQVQHGYLTDIDLLNGGWDVSVSGNGITITIHVAGGPDVVIILSNGPFLPTEMPHRLMTVNVVRIYNGF